MSGIVATITEIQNCENLNIVKFEANGQMLCMMSLELEKCIQVGASVKLGIKSTHLMISKNPNNDISCINQLQTTINSIEHGKLLSSIKLNFATTTLEAVITAEMAQNMQLKQGDHVSALIPESELAIVEVLDD